MSDRRTGDKELLKEMGQRISARRKELHLTQEQVAEKMGTSLQMVSNLELGKKAIRPENLAKLCNILDVSADYILRGRRSVSEISDFAERYERLSGEHQRIIGELIESLIDK